MRTYRPCISSSMDDEICQLGAKHPMPHIHRYKDGTLVRWNGSYASIISGR